MADIREELWRCIRATDVSKLRVLLDELPEGNYHELNLLQMVCETSETVKTRKAIRDMVLMLCDFGVDPNHTSYTIPPLVAAINNKNLTALRTLLQCSTDLIQLKKLQPSVLNSEMKGIIRQYQPGIWIAAQSSNISDVRRLINLWVRMDDVKYGKTLIEMAEETGNEQIIKLIGGIFHSMQLVHHVLARDSRKVSEVLKRGDLKARHKLNVRNLSDNGAPILFYAIQNNDHVIVKCLVEAGAQLFTLMRDAQGIECPVLFTAFRKGVQPEMVDALISETLFCESILQQLLYKSEGILEVALHSRIPLESFKLLLQRSGPSILVQRNCASQTIWESSNELNMLSYCDIIDDVVKEWVEVDERARHVLALHGYERIVETFGQKDLQDIPDAVKDYLSSLAEYQEWIDYLSESIYNSDLESFEGLSAYQGEHGNFFHCDLLWNARVKGDGLPLLHKAVLGRNIDMVNQILDAMEPFEGVDSLVDEYYRTALHYAHAMKETKQVKEIVNVLYASGASEHCLDKFGKEPLDFKEYAGTVAMDAYLENIRNREVISSTLEKAIWNQKPKKIREYKVQNHRHPHAHNHQEGGCSTEHQHSPMSPPWTARSLERQDSNSSWSSCSLQ